MKAFEAKIAAVIRKNRLLEQGDRVLVGLSGGPDSVALLCVLCALSKPLELSVMALHVHHGIRGQSADEDATFAKDLCAAKGVPFILKQADVPKLAHENRESIETAGRNARYALLRQTAEEQVCSVIALAHHRDDQAETVLMRLARGTGPAGACGMAMQTGNLIRPFLTVSKADILAYLGEINQPYRVDETNRDVMYSRNRIRREVLPALEAAHPGAAAHIAAFADRQASLVAFAQKQIQAAYQKNSKRDLLGRRYFEIEALTQADPFLRTALVREALTRAAQTAVDIEMRHSQIILDKLPDENNFDLAMPHGVTVRRRYERLIFESKDQKPAPFLGHYALTRAQIICDVPDGVFITVADGKKSSSNLQNGAQFALDCAKIKSNIDLMALRRRAPGDFVIVRGRHRSFKRYLIDRKTDRDLRDALPVLAIGNRIIWMPGIYADESLLAGADSGERRIVRLEKQDEPRN